MRPVVVISVQYRPHVLSEDNLPPCWCKPELVECQCDEGHEPVWRHVDVEPRPDNRERMAVFSEQLPLPVGWGGR